MYQLITAKDDGTDSIVIKLKDKPPTLYNIEPKKVLDKIYTVPYDRISEWAYWYAQNVIKSRWVEGEEVIKRDSELAFYYARHVIKGRWVEGEEVIKRSSMWACHYARYVIKGRWVEGEEVIKIDDEWWKEYKEKYKIKESYESSISNLA